MLYGRREGGVPIVHAARRIENSADGDRSRRFAIAPEALFDEHRAAHEEGLEVVGYYHSHPSGDGRPSVRDLETAWPSVSYLIVAPRDGASTVVRSWRLREDGRAFDEEEILYAGPLIDSSRSVEP